MKYVLYGIFFLSVLAACSEEGDIKISVTESEDTYEFFAKYNKHETQRVQDFINARIGPGSSVTGDHVDITTTLDDNTRFQLEEYPGKVRIKLNKDDNSEASYVRVKKMCEGIKRIIGEK